MNRLTDAVFQPLTRWAEHSQRRACRNAIAASTALAQVRRERDEVREFVEATLSRRRPRAGATSPLAHGTALLRQPEVAHR